MSNTITPQNSTASTHTVYLTPQQARAAQGTDQARGKVADGDRVFVEGDFVARDLRCQNLTRMQCRANEASLREKIEKLFATLAERLSPEQREREKFEKLFATFAERLSPEQRDSLSKKDFSGERLSSEQR